MNADPLARLLLLFALASLVAAPATAAPPMPSDAKALFLHHSTGGVIWGGGVPGWFDDYNAAHGTSYDVTETAYPDSPYPWENYPYDYWNLWVSHAGATPYLGQATLEMLAPQYQVIVFKHCFPVSAIGPDTGDPDVASPDKTLENYRLQYAALKSKLRSFPDNRFLVWTGAALRQQDTSPEQAARAKEFFDWVRDTWDQPDGGLYLTPDHASGDSHPNGTFAAEVAPLLCQRIVDVIRGAGDSTSVTGVTQPAAGLSFALAGPNPCGERVGLRFVLPGPAHVDLDVFDAAGRRLARILEGDFAAGSHAATWTSSTAAAGVYFARLRSGGRTLTRTIVRLP